MLMTSLWRSCALAKRNTVDENQKILSLKFCLLSHFLLTSPKIQFRNKNVLERRHQVNSMKVCNQLQ